MKFSIASVGISGTFCEKLSAVAAANFDGIELFEGDLQAFEGSAIEAGNMVRDFGLEVSLLQPFRDFEANPEPTQSRAFDRAERKFDLMQELGTDLMLLCSNVSPDALGDPDRAAEDLHELGVRAAKRNIRIGYEALSWGRYIRDHRDAWDIVRRANHANIGLILDSFHTLALRIDVQSIRQIPGDKIFLVQVADAPMLDMELLQWSRHFRNFPGQGDLDVKGFMKSVLATGYDGPVSLEIFNDHFWNACPYEISSDGFESITALMNDVRPQASDVCMALPQLPDRPEVTGIETIELVTSAEENKSLKTMLSALGFSMTILHYKNNLTLWQQGKINIVLVERNKFYDESVAMQAPEHTSCCLYLGVAKTTDAIVRAQALGFTVSEHDHYWCSRKPHVLKGPGLAVCFLAETADRTSSLISQRPRLQTVVRDVGLQSIDHITQLASQYDALRSTLFYRNLLSTSKKPMLEVIGPSGLIRSQSIETTNRSLRININSITCQIDSFVSSGYGLQHISLAAEDIFQTAERLRENACSVLSISPNYYADLDARQDLATELLVKLREFNILYDRNDDGEYYQLFSQNCSHGLFFEIVQRTGSYSGYGTPIQQIGFHSGADYIQRRKV